MKERRNPRWPQWREHAFYIFYIAYWLCFLIHSFFLRFVCKGSRPDWLQRAVLHGFVVYSVTNIWNKENRERSLHCRSACFLFLCPYTTECVHSLCFFLSIFIRSLFVSVPFCHWFDLSLFLLLAAPRLANLICFIFRSIWFNKAISCWPYIFTDSQ